MPPKSKKKAAKNAFWFFAMEWKKEKEEQGQRFRDLQEVTELCSEDWKYLPDNLRNRYKAMEKDAKQTNKGDSSNKYNSLGVSFDVIDEQLREKAFAARKMNDDIDSIIGSVSSSVDALKQHCFYLVHVNSYCYWGFKRIYIPCEVAICKFNLQDGIVDVFHVFPAPKTDNGQIPVGYKFEALENAKLVHGIPIPTDWNRSEFDWVKITSDVLTFLSPHGGPEYPPVFTMDGGSLQGTVLNCEMAAVNHFFDIIRDFSETELRVYNIGLLFFKLYGTCHNMAVKMFGDQAKAFPVEGVALQQLTKDIYNYCPGISCEFHNDTELFHNCSLSFVKRWVFLMCEFCCPALRISLIPNRHCIASAEVIVSQPSRPSGSNEPCRTSGLPPVKSNTRVQDRFSDDSDSYHTPQTNLSKKSFPMGEDHSSSSSDGWSTVTRAQPKMRTATTNNQRIPPRSENLVMIDRPKVPEPSQTQILRTGQAANCASEVMPNTAGPSVRLPTTRGRGEILADLQRQQQAQSPGASFSEDDFPAIGGNRPGHLAKPMAKSWGRGFLKQ